MILMLWTVFGTFYVPEIPGLRKAANKLAIRLGEKTGRVVDSVNMHGVTPITVLPMIEDGVANLVRDSGTRPTVPGSQLK